MDNEKQNVNQNIMEEQLEKPATSLFAQLYLDGLGYPNSINL